MFIIKKYEHLKNLIYTLYLLPHFKKYGINCRIEIPINLFGANNIELGDYVGIGKNSILECITKYGEEKFNPSIYIGSHSNIGQYSHISSCRSIYIGENVLMGRFVYISDNNHGNSEYRNLKIEPSKRVLNSKGEIEIGSNVWIGDKVTILSGVHIGEGSIIGANSVVTKNFPPYSIVGGGPAHIIKQVDIH